MTNKKQKAVLKLKHEEFVDRLSETLVIFGKVKVVGMGIFEVKHVAAREGYNVNDKKRIVISAHKKVSFRPTKSLRDIIQTYDGD